MCVPIMQEDMPENPPLTIEALQTCLIRAGANERLLDMRWTANCARWSLWKLHSYAYTFPNQSKQFLEKGVLVDEKMKR